MFALCVVNVREEGPFCAPHVPEMVPPGFTQNVEGTVRLRCRTPKKASGIYFDAITAR